MTIWTVCDKNLALFDVWYDLWQVKSPQTFTIALWHVYKHNCELKSTPPEHCLKSAILRPMHEHILWSYTPVLYHVGNMPMMFGCYLTSYFIMLSPFYTLSAAGTCFMALTCLLHLHFSLDLLHMLFWCPQAQLWSQFASLCRPTKIGDFSGSSWWHVLISQLCSAMSPDHVYVVSSQFGLVLLFLCMFLCLGYVVCDLNLILLNAHAYTCKHMQPMNKHQLWSV